MKLTERDKELKKNARDFARNNPDMLTEFRQYTKALYIERKNNADHLQISDWLYHWFVDLYGQKGVLGCRLLLTAHNQRVQRLSKRIEFIVLDAKSNGKSLYFMTFTFTDKYLNNTQHEYRRKMINRLLHEYCDHYVCNVDYGEDDEKTHREHYHAFVETNNLNELKKKYYEITKSFVHAKDYRNKKRDSKYVAHYIIKLVNHTIKSSTGNERTLFDRYPFKGQDVENEKQHRLWVDFQLRKPKAIEQYQRQVIDQIVEEFEKDKVASPFADTELD